MKRYGYHRTSTREQHLYRGIKEITAYCEQNNLELEKIFTDQQTGKNFNRPRYQVLKEDVLRAGDELIINLERDIDAIYDDDKYAERKRQDMNNRLNKIYEEIYDIEDRITDSEKKKEAAQQDVLTKGNVLT